MLKCRDIADRADSYVDKELTWYQRLSWKIHFLLCPPCKHFIDQFSTSLDVARRVGRNKQTASEEDVNKVNDLINKHIDS